MLNLYLLTQNKNTGWDTYLGFVIAAKSELQAKEMSIKESGGAGMWVSNLQDIKCKYIGEYKYKTPKVILESFNAG